MIRNPYQSQRLAAVLAAAACLGVAFHLNRALADQRGITRSWGRTNIRCGRRMAPPKRKWDRKKKRTYKGHGFHYYDTSAKKVASKR